MHLPAFSSLLAWVGAIPEAAAPDEAVKNVAIIGAGAAGASAAYHLQRFAAEEDVAVNITIFEKTDRIGGRTLTVNALDNPAEPIELGASIFVTVNRILFNATRDFDLSLGTLTEGAPGDVTAIWDGERLVYQSTEGSSWWWDTAKLFWRYGTSPYRAVKLVNGVVAKFLKMYEEPWFPFRSLTQRVFELELEKITGITGEQFLQQNQINLDFSREIIQAATRVNYASNLAYIHGVEAMVSFATDGAVSVAGGNWKIFDNMVNHSGAALYRNATVSSIALDAKKTKNGAPRYRVSTKDTANLTALAEGYPVSFDKIIVASPWQFSNIAADEDVIRHTIEEIPYMKLHVTLFSSPYKLRPGFFGLEDGAKAPSNVYTTLGADEEPRMGAAGVGRTGFYSISTLRRVVNPKTEKREFVYKIFSPEPVTTSFLSDILGVNVPEGFTADSSSSPISWYHPTWFHSYPVELPRVTFQDPIVGDGVYYTSGMEGFISTMETSALMGMNVARLIADDVAGVERTAEGRRVEKEEKKEAATGEEL